MVDIFIGVGRTYHQAKIRGSSKPTRKDKGRGLGAVLFSKNVREGGKMNIFLAEIWNFWDF